VCAGGCIGRVKVLLRGVGIGVVASVGAGACVTVAIAYGVFHDFDAALWAPGHLVREGLSPYPSAHDATTSVTSPYTPPLILLAGVPLSFFHFYTAGVIWALFLTASCAAALWFVEVRDPRCYIAALLSVPMLGAVGTGNPTPVVILLAALAYRYRDRLWCSGLAIGAAIVVKPFVLPMVVWDWRTKLGRRRGAAAAAVAGALMFVGWALIGFKGLLGYPHLLSRDADRFGSHGASVYAFALQLGAGGRLSLLISLGAAGVVLLAGRGSFEAVVLASLLDSPITWSAYFALLYLVVAARSPSFSLRWLIGLAYTPLILNANGPRPLWAIALAIGAAGYVCLVPTGTMTSVLGRLIPARQRLAGQTSAA
jgi:glycosyl transferase family 87